MCKAIPNLNVEMSPESHDPAVREAFGKHYGNRALEAAVEAFLRAGTKRLDLFFMVGLPGQDYQSVMDTAGYCETLMERFESSGRLLPMLAPLAPFIDPGSRVFEDPGAFGYRIFYRTLAEHREAMLKPSWKHSLNYQTLWMTRDDIVAATYDGALRLLEMKRRYGLLDERTAGTIKARITKAQELMGK